MREVRNFFDAGQDFPQLTRFSKSIWGKGQGSPYLMEARRKIKKGGTFL